MPRIDWTEVPLFEGLTGDHLRGLEAMATVEAFDSGGQIFRQDQVSDRLHFILSGTIKVVSSRPDGQEVILEILGAGDPVGMVAALEEVPYPATAVGHEAGRVLVLPRDAFMALVRDEPDLCRRLLAGFCRRNLQLVRRLADFPGRAAARIARLLAILAERFGEQDGRAVRIPLNLSRQEMADLVGTTLETSIRTLSRWSKEGLVKTEADGFHIPDMEALRRLMER